MPKQNNNSFYMSGYKHSLRLYILKYYLEIDKAKI